MENKLTIEHQYQLFLQRIALSEDTMHPVQKQQLRLAFFGACGQMILLLRDDIAELGEDEGIEVLESMLQEVKEYAMNSLNSQN